MAVRGYFCASFNTFVLDPYIFGIDLFSCMFCFPNSDHVIFSREFAFSLFIIMYTYARGMHVHRTTVERNCSLWYRHAVCNGATKCIQAKKVFSMDAKKVLAFFSFRCYTDTKGTYHAVLIKPVFVERGFAVIYVFFFFNVDPPLKQSSQGEPAGKGVTEAAVWDAWVRRF